MHCATQSFEIFAVGVIFHAWLLRVLVLLSSPGSLN
ncbi:hypothetical protein SAMN05421878_11245 [Actinobaculum suis]|uniref:Uncharacterized protein n=1 Tax=Actinobaculum suis TaxID=1657 RepID=A0A1G7DQA7_9ACTO|nr:hypothetical protein SAMN05421878_11245 [Actinobaculum suis]VDG75891.1 Uncharacterised protein [Actinobaculum suis]